MKQLNLLITFLLLTTLIKAQTPQGFNYSAVARDATGKPLANRSVSVQLSILKTSPTGALQYAENHLVNTDGYGLFNLVVGNGTAQSGSISNIQWGSDNHYLKVAIDANGGSNFITMGTTQIMRVPYALNAKKADNGVKRVSADGDTLYLINNQIFVPVSISHYIGELFGGGVIFHLWKDLQGIEHGLIVDLNDLSTSQIWSDVSSIEIGQSAHSIWEGLSNSNAIVTQLGHTKSAAALCLNSTNGGYNDWYLPSIDETSLIFKNRFNVNKAILLNGGVELSYLSSYWTSTEYTIDRAYTFNFFYFNETPKLNANIVRAIRSF